jgi:histidinol-phosphate aminotransferase
VAHEPRVPLRPAVAALPAYVPGGRVAPGAAAFKLSSNENPYPPLPSVVAAIADAAADVNRYPDMYATELVEALADRLGVTAAEVVVGNGSVAVLAHVLQTVVEPGDEVVYPWRSFEAYPIAVAVAGGTSVQVPLLTGEGRGRLDLRAMAAAVTERTRVVLVCTPNNPTGPVVHRDEVDAFLAAVPSDVLVVLDEAYLEFVRDPQAPDGLAVYAKHPNVVLLRTFSKAYGLAGLRVGYAVARPGSGPCRPRSASRTSRKGRRWPPCGRATSCSAGSSTWSRTARVSSRACATRAGSCRRPRPTSCGSTSATAPSSGPRRRAPRGRSSARSRARACA